ncbi:iron-containing alcohol dehydrogenase family protein [Fundidesulfovibrio agrisoli]|uniref:iron-containing alcohol dehydrogenase family protein n=1 Tax=Fundidesulfovibrio agrisoli TaxID=2922717 RepID=UPI001FABDAE1|nr:iron-containing alcohol dehydrogenase [Fundidesulfovibrio agrisoli]
MSTSTADFFLSPPRIVYGPGSLSCLGGEAAKLGRKALVVTGRGSSAKSGSLEKVRQALLGGGLEVTVFAEVEPDPSVATVEKGVALARERGCDLIVALGGGSPLDAGKAISLMLGNPGSIQDYEASAPERSGPPVIAIPTTAGTGSEVTRIAVITDTAAKRKTPIFGDMMVPALAILDAELTVSMPRHVTAATGMDALTHAIEAYLSRKANLLTDPLALAAISTIAANLPVALDYPEDLEARQEMLLGQLQAGLAFSNSSVGLVHSMSRPLGAMFGVPHGAANAMLLPAVTAYNLSRCKKRLGGVALALGCREPSAKAAVWALKDLFAETGLPAKLSDYGVTEEAIPAMSEDALAAGSSRLNPRQPELADIEGIYRSLL